jgi:tetratricopeptide (TPR) repeat protein
MIRTLILLLALQGSRAIISNSGRTSTDPGTLNAPGLTDHFKDGISIIGKIVFPSDVKPTFLEVELEDVNGHVVRSVKSGPNREFRFDRVLLPDFNATYFISINAEGFDVVHQQVVLTAANFTSAEITIQLKHAPGSLNADLEDVVSFKSLSQTPAKDAQKLYERAREQQRKDETKKAVDDLEKALKLYPDYYEANLQLGLEYEKQGRIDEATQLLERALKLNPGSMKARAALGQIYCDTGKFEEAAAMLKEAVRMGSTASSVYFALGLSLSKLDDLDRAEDSLRRAMVISNGSLGQGYLLLHNIYIKRKQLDKALQQLDAYLLKFPNAADREEVQSRADRLRKAVGPGR